MEVIGFIIGWGSAIWFASTRFKKYGSWGALYVIGAVALAWIGVLGAFIIHSVARGMSSGGSASVATAQSAPPALSPPPAVPGGFAPARPQLQRPSLDRAVPPTQASAVQVPAVKAPPSPEQFCADIKKVHGLFAAQMLDPDEFSTRKAAVIRKLEGPELPGSAEDYLVAIAPLKQAEMITAEELGAIKRLLLAAPV